MVISPIFLLPGSRSDAYPGVTKELIRAIGVWDSSDTISADSYSRLGGVEFKLNPLKKSLFINEAYLSHCLFYEKDYLSDLFRFYGVEQPKKPTESFFCFMDEFYCLIAKSWSHKGVLAPLSEDELNKRFYSALKGSVQTFLETGDKGKTFSFLEEGAGRLITASPGVKKAQVIWEYEQFFKTNAKDDGIFI